MSKKAAGIEASADVKEMLRFMQEQAEKQAEKQELARIEQAERHQQEQKIQREWMMQMIDKMNKSSNNNTADQQAKQNTEGEDTFDEDNEGFTTVGAGGRRGNKNTSENKLFKQDFRNEAEELGSEVVIHFRSGVKQEGLKLPEFKKLFKQESRDEAEGIGPEVVIHFRSAVKQEGLKAIISTNNSATQSKINTEIDLEKESEEFTEVSSIGKENKISVNNDLAEQSEKHTEGETDPNKDENGALSKVGSAGRKGSNKSLAESGKQYPEGAINSDKVTSQIIEAAKSSHSTAVQSGNNASEGKSTTDESVQGQHQHTEAGGVGAKQDEVISNIQTVMVHAMHTMQSWDHSQKIVAKAEASIITRVTQNVDHAMKGSSDTDKSVEGANQQIDRGGEDNIDERNGNSLENSFKSTTIPLTHQSSQTLVNSRVRNQEDLDNNATSMAEMAVGTKLHIGRVKREEIELASGKDSRIIILLEAGKGAGDADASSISGAYLPITDLISQRKSKDAAAGVAPYIGAQTTRKFDHSQSGRYGQCKSQKKFVIPAQQISRMTGWAGELGAKSLRLERCYLVYGYIT